MMFYVRVLSEVEQSYQPVDWSAGHGFRTRGHVHTVAFRFTLMLLAGCCMSARGQSAASRALEFPPKTSGAQAEAPATQLQLLEAQGELMRLPPLATLIATAQKNATGARSIDLVMQQEGIRAQMAKLRSFDVLGIQGVAIAGRRDVFAVNSDGSISTPSAALIDNTNVQGSIGLRFSPMQFLINRKAQEMARVETERLLLQREGSDREIAEGVTQLYNMAQKSLDLMDLRADGAEIMTTNAEMAKRLFQQGGITLHDYSEITNKAIEATAKFQDARGDFRMYYQMLMTRVYGKLP